VEKPITDDVASATKLVEAAEAAQVPLLVGHHSRFNPLIRKAKEAVESGRLGRVLAAHGFFWIYKPDDYFAIPWRREKGAGPMFLNLIHDVDNLRYLLGNVVSVLIWISGKTEKQEAGGNRSTVSAYCSRLGIRLLCRSVISAA
jgi:predicted dehydrogenase